MLLFGTSCTQKENHKNNIEIKNSELTYMGFGERSIGLKLFSKNSIIKNETEINAEIRVPRDYQGPIKYQWKLGSNVELVSGDLEQVIQVNPNQKLEFKILVKNFKNSKPQFVRFEASGANQTKSIYTDGLVSSNQTESFENIVQKVEEYNANK